MPAVSWIFSVGWCQLVLGFSRITSGSELSRAGTFMATITKKELIDRIADSTDQRRVQVKRVVQQFLDQIIAELGKGNRLEFRDFGVFETKLRKARRAQNPKTLQPVEVPEKRTVKFKVGRLMKQKLADLTGASIDDEAGDVEEMPEGPDEETADPNAEGAPAAAKGRRGIGLTSYCSRNWPDARGSTSFDRGSLSLPSMPHMWKSTAGDM